MKPYGIPRDRNVDAPDCLDTITFALSPRAGGNLPGPGGDTHNTFRNPDAKAHRRRRHARRARAGGQGRLPGGLRMFSEAAQREHLTISAWLRRAGVNAVNLGRM